MLIPVFNNAIAAVADGTGKTINAIDENLQNTYNAWQNAPSIGNFKLIMNLPALLITVLITYVVYIGIKESKKSK